MKKNKKWNLILILCVSLWLNLSGCQRGKEVVFVDADAVQEDGADSQNGIAIDSEEDSQTTGRVETYQAETETVLPVETVFVHVCGAVVSPGVYELDINSRVIDAVELAGGAAENAALDYINLASMVADGDKIWIPTLEEASQMNVGSVPGAPEAESSDKVNINTADISLLCTLPGIGETRAKSIIAYREENGSFGAIEDVMQVSGIKESCFQKIKDLIRVQ